MKRGKDLKLKALMIAQKKAWEDLYEAQYQVKDPLLRPHEVEYMKGNPCSQRKRLSACK